MQSFLNEHCVREETSPCRQWLGVKEMLLKYNDEMDKRLQEKEIKDKLKNNCNTSNDYKEKGEAVLCDRPLRRNTANGLLNWRLRTADERDTSDVKRQRISAVHGRTDALHNR